jgi:23S rRNA (adenine-N6)-dimethyltransferase
MSHHHRSNVSHTQNFLRSPQLVEQIVGLAALQRHDLVIEIGPGKGIITDALVRRSDHVLVIEKDPRYVDLLLRRYAECPRVAVFGADVLDFPMPATAYKVFASIPYDITTAIVAKLTSGIAPPADAFLIVQREAAERFCGRPAETLVSLGVKPWFESRILHRFDRSDFRPVPAVDSVLIRIERRVQPVIAAELADRYRNLLAAVFSAWKPTVEAALREFMTPDMVNRLRSTFGNSLRCRPSLLPFERWIELFTLLTEIGDDRLWESFAHAHARLRQQQGSLQKQHRSRTSDRSDRGPRPHQSDGRKGKRR